MFVRATKHRSLLFLTLLSAVTFAVIKRLLSSSEFNLENHETKLFLHRYSSNYFISPIHNELLQLTFPVPRISPSEIVKPLSLREYVTKPLSYDETVFRQASFPILWLDRQYDVRWNQAAERQMLAYLTEKQFPNVEKSSSNDFNISNICRGRSLFFLHQHLSGFFSRVLCFIAQFGQTLYTPRIGVLGGSSFMVGRGQHDDFLGQGILRYFLPFSICSAYMYHRNISEIRAIVEQSLHQHQIIRSEDLHSHGNDENNHVLSSREYWKLDYHHVPIRKWLFDRKKSDVKYGSSIEILSNHSDEHIYAPGNAENVTIGDWIHRNKPDAFSSDLLPNRGKYVLTWKDYVFGSFLRYMFVLYFTSQNAPRIEVTRRILAEYWSNFLIDKYSLPKTKTVDPFDDLAGLYIRRGDKSTEDTFWHKHRRWRNISYYVKGLVDEENQRKTKFKSIFVMTDDASVMQSLIDYSNPQSKGTDEPYAREHLTNRNILYNVLAPQTCFDPFHRNGFDQFLVSMRFLIEYSRFTIGHTDSNVFRFFREVIYAQRQHHQHIQSFTFAKNAPDSL
ncbi:hypothetical protein I4U23_024495 [Adineta vaga]|nr:hypothetical protein I4U23_024495 [Adineta vaga]